MAVRCERCGVESPFDWAFLKVRGVLPPRLLAFCPRCASIRRASSRRSVVLFYVAVTALGAGLATQGRWGLLNLCVGAWMMMLLILPHELGHAGAAALLGARVFSISIGMWGDTVFERTRGGIRWEIKAFPLGGLTVAADAREDLFRLRRFLIVLGGPLVNLLLLTAAVRVASSVGRLDFHLRDAFQPGALFVVANALVLVANLVPYRAATPFGPVPNDGLALVTLPFLTPADVARHIAGYHLLEGEAARRRRRFAEARERYARGLERFPDHALLRNNLAVTLLDLRDGEAARPHLLHLVAREPLEPGLRPLVFNNLAAADLLIGRPDLLAEADRYSEEAFRHAPWLAAVRGTRGGALVETGRVDEGLALVRGAMETLKDPAQKAILACYAAMGEKRKGNDAEARQCLETARALDPECPLLARAGGPPAPPDG